eukprot:jgi/Botrbrau1/12535/Bobra.0169s0077.1
MGRHPFPHFRRKCGNTVITVQITCTSLRSITRLQHTCHIYAVYTACTAWNARPLIYEINNGPAPVHDILR